MKLRIYFLFSILYILVLYFSLLLFQNTTFLKTNKYPSYIISTLLPEGWSFFTIPPRSEKIYIYKIISNNKVILINKKLSSYKHFLGIKRKYYNSRFELPNILKNITDTEYVSIAEIKEIKLLNMKEIKLTNYHKNPTFFGNYIIEKKMLKPWLLFMQNSSINMPSKVIKVNISFVENSKK